MAGVDECDQLRTTYSFSKRNRKWYQVLHHSVMEVALVNAKTPYGTDNPNKKLTQKSLQKN